MDTSAAVADKYSGGTHMRKTISTIAAALLLGATLAHAQAPDKINLLTENFPPYNMADDGKNFARDEHITGIAADIVREMFKRAGIDYTLTLRFPWERIYGMALEQRNYGVFVTARLPEREEDRKSTRLNSSH